MANLNEIVQSNQPGQTTTPQVLNEPVLAKDGNKAKGGDGRGKCRDAMQGLWACTMCVCCLNGCFTLADNISGCL